MIGDAQAQIVRHEVRVQHRLHHRMAPVFDRDEALVDETRADVPALGGALGERGQRVDLRDRVGGRQQPLHLGRDAFEKFGEELLLEALLTNLRRRNGELELLEFRRDVTLAVGERLLAQILRRDRIRIVLSDLDGVAERADVLHFQRLDAGSFPLALLEFGELRARVGPQSDALGQLRAGLGGYRAAVAQLRRRILRQRSMQIVEHLAEVADALE